VGLKRIVDGELHPIRRERVVRAGLVRERDGELVAVGERPCDDLAGRPRDRDLRVRRGRRAGGVQHPLQQREPFQPFGDGREVAARRMAPRAGGGEVLLARIGVAGLQIREVHGAASAGQRFRFRLLVVNEGDDSREIALAEGEGGHAFVGAAVAHDRSKRIAAHIGSDARGAGEIGPGFAAHRIAPMAEAALRGKDRLPCADLFRWIRLRCCRRRRRHRCGTRLRAAAAGRRLRSIHRREIRSGAHGVRAREVRRHLLGDAAARRPLRAALKRDDEVHRAQRADVVSHGGVKHAPAAVAEHQELRFVAAGSVVGGVGMRGSPARSCSVRARASPRTARRPDASTRRAAPW